MAELEKVINGLTCCIDHNDCKKCPYANEYDPIFDCIDKTRKDALELLKGQQEIVRCKDCQHHFRDQCTNMDGACYQSFVGDDWFCADGELED